MIASAETGQTGPDTCSADQPEVEMQCSTTEQFILELSTWHCAGRLEWKTSRVNQK